MKKSITYKYFQTMRPELGLNCIDGQFVIISNITEGQASSDDGIEYGFIFNARKATIIELLDNNIEHEEKQDKYSTEDCNLFKDFF